MKRITLMVLILLITFAFSSCRVIDEIPKTPSDNNNSTKINISLLKEEGYSPIEEQSFWTNLENWGEVKFVSCTYPDGGTFKLHFYLVDKDDFVLYEFPKFYGNQWSTFYEFGEVSIKDADGDGIKDIAIIAYYMTGVGPTGAIPFPVTGIYYQKDKEFISISDLDDKINGFSN